MREAWLTVDFTRAAYPPLVSKWGGVAHPQWDNVTDDALAQLANDTAREAAVVLGVIQLGTTMSNDTTPIFERDASGVVHPVLSPRRLALRRLRGGVDGVRPILQFDGCPTPAFAINSSSVPSPHARYYPMCAYDQLDELAGAFGDYARQLHDADGLPTSWSWWPEPAHTLSDDKGSDALKLANFERYLDFYVRAAPAVRAAAVDDAISGWQLNAANCDAHEVSNDSFCRLATRRFLARERRANATYPVDAFTLQDYKGAESATLVANARLALCSDADDDDTAASSAAAPSSCPLRFARTPVTLVRFMETKDVHPDFTTKSGVAALLDEYALTAELPDVDVVAHSRWEDFYGASFGGDVAPMVLAALRRARAMPTFRVPVTVSSLAATEDVVEAAASEPRRLTRLGSRASNAPLWGLASLNGTAQCFMLWSRLDEPVAVQLTLELHGRPAPAPRGSGGGGGGGGGSFDLYTLGPKHADFVPLQTVQLPPPPATSVAIPLHLSKPYQVVQGCVGIGGGRDTPPPPEPARLAASGDALYARHDVLVPRAADPALTPAGMGHYDTFRRTLTVAFSAVAATDASNGAAADDDTAAGVGAADDERVGVASVVLRGVAPTKVLELSLQRHGATAALAAPARAAAGVSVRLDFLNRSEALATVELTSDGADPAELWVAGPARAWPLAAARNCQRSTLPAFDAAGHVSVHLGVGDWAPAGWAAADGGARRVRLSILARPVPPVGLSAAAVAAPDGADAFAMTWS